MLGFRQLFINQLINSTAHVSISVREDPVTEHSLDSFFFPDSLVKWFDALRAWAADAGMLIEFANLVLCG